MLRPKRKRVSGAAVDGVVTTENSDWATNCPEYKVTAVQVGLKQGQHQAAEVAAEAPVEVFAK